MRVARSHVQTKRRILKTYNGFRRAPVWSLFYLFSSRELANFTYKLGNLDELAASVAEIVGCSRATSASYIEELKRDGELRARLRHQVRSHKLRGTGVEFGRRFGWYAIVRATRPALVLETGVDTGLGSALLLRALERNAEEHAPGTLISVDIREDVGALVDAQLAARWTLVIDDSVAAIAKLGAQKVGVFIHDSEHTYEHEAAELNAVRSIMAPGAVLISDNAHASAAFKDFCAEYGLPFHLFVERPRRHFYPGAAMAATRLSNEN
jgi:predicted O-methyltransferase YrrM